MSSVITTIPVYKTQVNDYEKVSLERVKSILGEYPIGIVAPQSLNTSWYEDFFGRDLLKVYRFKDSYFKSPQTYNRLLCSLNFFKAFREYEFFLMYHTDAYVFRDELEDWCKKNYDYIGAPMYRFDGTITPPEEDYIGVGNGGFSLHKVSSAIKVLTTFKRVYPLKNLIKWYRRYNWKGRLRYLPYLVRMLMGLGGNSHHWLNYARINEDMFWGIYVPGAFSEYRVASFEEAYQFSMEYNCQKLLEYNGGKLPFGTHMWYKGDFLKFWKDKMSNEAVDSKSV